MLKLLVIRDSQFLIYSFSFFSVISDTVNDAKAYKILIKTQKHTIKETQRKNSTVKTSSARNSYVVTQRYFMKKKHQSKIYFKKLK